MPSRPQLAPGDSEHKPPLSSGAPSPDYSPRLCACHPGCLLSLRPSLPSPLSLLSPPQDSALPKISPPGTVPTPEESDLENVKMPSSKSPHQHTSFLPLLSTER